jgi:hypothetical protein
MRGVDVLRMQLTGSCSMVADAARESATDWERRAFPGSSRPGFALWHCARIIDWGVNAVVRDVPEIAEQPAWRDRVRYELGHGAGLSDELADEVARSVGPGDVAEYAEALRAEAGQWLDSIADADLDRPADVRRASARLPRYATPAAWEEVESLDGVPVWQVLARPCISHIRMHIGEIEVLRQALATGLAVIQ